MFVTKFSDNEQPVAEACRSTIETWLNSLKPTVPFEVYLEKDPKGEVYVEMRNDLKANSAIRNEVRHRLMVASICLPGKPALRVATDMAFPSLVKLALSLISLEHKIDLAPLGPARTAETAGRT